MIYYMRVLLKTDERIKNIKQLDYKNDLESLNSFNEIERIIERGKKFKLTEWFNKIDIININERIKKDE